MRRWDIAVMSMGGLRGACGDMPGIGERLVPDPRTRSIAGGLKVVPTVWAQRGVNSYRWVDGDTSRITVDGVAGRETLAALQAIRLRIMSTYSPIPTDPAIVAPVSIIDTGHVAIPANMHDLFAQYDRVNDPAGSVARCSWNAEVAPDTTIGPELDPRTAPNAGTGWEWIRYVALAAGTAVGVGVVLVGVGARYSR